MAYWRKFLETYMFESVFVLSSYLTDDLTGFKIMGLLLPKNIYLPSFAGVKEGLSLSCQEQGWRPINLVARSANFQPVPSFSTPCLTPLS